MYLGGGGGGGGGWMGFETTCVTFDCDKIIRHNRILPAPTISL